MNNTARILRFYGEKELYSPNYSPVLNCQIYPHIGAVSQFSVENREPLDKITSVTLLANEFYKLITPFIDLLETHEYVGMPLNLTRHALTALFLFRDMHSFGFHQDLMWVWFAEISRTLGHSWLHWRRVLKFYENYTLAADIHPEDKYKYDPIMFDKLPFIAQRGYIRIVRPEKAEISG